MNGFRRIVAGRPNRAVPLFSGPVVVTAGMRPSIRRFVEIALHWTPQPHIAFDLEADGLMDLRHEERVTLGFPQGWDIPVDLVTFHSSRGVSPGAPASEWQRLSWRGRGELTDVRLGGGDLDSVELWLADLHNLRVVTRERGQERSSRPIQQDVEITAGGWNIAVTQPADPSRWREFERHGGHALTTRLQVTRTDGARFEPPDVLALAEGIGLSVSFLRGNWCTAAVMTGKKGARRTWFAWSVGHTDPLVLRPSSPVTIERLDSDRRVSSHESMTWDPSRDMNVLERFLPRFIALWADKSWQPTLRLAISLRLHAAAHPPETGIVVAQQALEQLAWTVLVAGSDRLSRDGFERLPASDRLRLALTAQNIPITIAPRLRDPAARASYQDGPHAITDIRNSLVHPSKVTRIQDFIGKDLETWRRFALEYIDLMLLRLTDYAGPYVSSLSLPIVRAGQLSRPRSPRKRALSS